MYKTIASLTVMIIVGATASGEEFYSSERSGEALAWTVAAYGSCEDTAELQSDFRRESIALDASFEDVTNALGILATAANVCELQVQFAQDMRELSHADADVFAAKFVAAHEPVSPEFVIEAPMGADESQTDLIMNAAKLPPPRGNGPQPVGSDYQ